MIGDGDGWSAGPGDTKMWGLFGAAGLFLVADLNSGPEVLLQHRAPWTASGGTWGIPGGARDSHESPEIAALRETVEETCIDPSHVEVLKAVVTSGPFPDDPARPRLPGGWTYTSVIACTDERLETIANEESLELRWVPLEIAPELNLHPAFRRALPQLVELWHELSQE